MEKNNKKQSGNINLFRWNMEEKELQNQIENYDNLSFFKSARKIATFLMILSATIDLICVMVGYFSSIVWIDIITVLTLSFFVYKGKRWAIIVAMIYWTFSKGLQIFNIFPVLSSGNLDTYNAVIIIIWWTIFIGAFWQAYQVEKARHKVAIKR